MGTDPIHPDEQEEGLLMNHLISYTFFLVIWPKRKIRGRFLGHIKSIFPPGRVGVSWSVKAYIDTYVYFYVRVLQ